MENKLMIFENETFGKVRTLNHRRRGVVCGG